MSELPSIFARSVNIQKRVEIGPPRDHPLFGLSLFFATPNLKCMFTAVECVRVDDRCDLLAAVSRT